MQKKRRTHVKVDESAANNPDAPKIPKSFVFKSGDVGKTVEALVRDMRRVMEPHTAIRLKVIDDYYIYTYIQFIFSFF